jgi:hypothetical protein
VVTPQSIVNSINFEQAAIEAIQATFLSCAIHGYLFHLTKNMRKKLADEGLLRRYNTNPDFALVARMLVALSFVPIEDLDVALEALENEIMEDLTPIINGF